MSESKYIRNTYYRRRLGWDQGELSHLLSLLSIDSFPPSLFLAETALVIVANATENQANLTYKEASVNKRFVSLVLSLAITASFAHAQLLEIAGVYLANKLLAGGQKKEADAGKIGINVWHREDDGSLTFVSCWDASTGTTVAWPDGFVLEPVVLINRIRDPREMQFHLDSSQGPRTIAYVGIKGGKRGPNGTAVDNRGYVRKAPMIDVKDLPMGFIGIGATWGSGAAYVQFVHLDFAKALEMISCRPDLQRGLAGAGHSTYPVAPVTLALIDGSMKTFMSPEEVELYLKEMTQPLVKTNPTTVPSDPPKTEPNVEPWGGGFQLGFFKGPWTALSEQDLRGKPARHFDKLSSEMADENALAVLLTDSKPFGVVLLDKEGNQKGEAMKAKLVQGHYELLLKVTLDGQPKAALIVADADQHSSVLELTRKGE